MLCPRVINCSSHTDLVSFDLGKTPSYISITSSGLSCLGSILILFAYFSLKDIRTGAQKVITLLAIADFFTAFGYIIGSVNFLTHFNHSARSSDSCEVFTDICEVQSFITTWSTMCSYSWTCTLAFYFFLTLVFDRASLAARLIPLYNVICWLGPLSVVFPLLATGNLGYAPYVASNWCYIKDTDFNKEHLLEKPKVIGFLFLGGKFWEILSYLFVVVLYVWMKIYLAKTKKSVGGVSSVEKRLLAIPLLYILLRMWGTLQFFYSMAVDHTNVSGCIPKTVQRGYFILGILQAIGDGGQGWGNAILYIFFSPNIRRRLFGEPCNKCLLAAEEKLQMLLETETESGHPRSIQTTKVHSEENSLIPSGNTVTGGQSAKGYGVKSYQKDSTSGVSTTATHSTATSNVLVLSNSAAVGPN